MGAAGDHHASGANHVWGLAPGFAKPGRQPDHQPDPPRLGDHGGLQ